MVCAELDQLEWDFVQATRIVGKQEVIPVPSGLPV